MIGSESVAIREDTIVSVVAVIMAWVSSGLVTYGFMKAKLLEFDRRLMELENGRKEFITIGECALKHDNISIGDFITYKEYDARHKELREELRGWLERVEKKLDTAIAAGNRRRE